MKKRKLPLVSIVVPTYNNEDTIETTLLSLTKQTHPAKEIIVVYDEGSTDNTKQILIKTSHNFPQLIRVISTSHIGRSAARNLGWKKSNGEILFFADADDIYNEDYLEKAVECLQSNLQFGGVTVTGAYLKLESTFVTECMDVHGKIQRKLFNKGKIKLDWAWVYTRETIEKVGGFDEKLSQAEDKDLYLRVKKAGYSLGIVTGVNWYHTRRGSLQVYIKNSYIGGKRRILFVLKHRKWINLFKGMISFWILLLAFLTSIFFIQLFYVLCLGIVAVLAYKLLVTLKLGWDCVQKKRYLFLFPLFGVIEYLATAIGYTHGITVVCFEKLTGQKIVWSKI